MMPDRVAGSGPRGSTLLHAGTLLIKLIDKCTRPSMQAVRLTRADVALQGSIGSIRVAKAVEVHAD